jgi:hypothetical protein
MKIVRQTDTQVAVRDSSLWVSAICGIAFLFIVTMTARAGNWRGMLASCLLLVFTVAWLRRSTFVFDASTHTVSWNRLRYLRSASGAIPFSEISDIAVETTTSDKANLTYRLVIVTPSEKVPMSDVYTAGQNRISALRNTLMGFMTNPKNPPTPPPLPPAATENPDAERAAQLNNSVRSLLEQGRKVDAILLVQRADHLDLTEATFRVNQIDNQMRSKTIRH